MITLLNMHRSILGSDYIASEFGGLNSGVSFIFDITQNLYLLIIEIFKIKLAIVRLLFPSWGFCR